MNVEKPIFIVGTGRSGSSVFHRLFSKHPGVAWLSARLADRFPDRPRLGRYLLHGIDLPLVGRFLRRRFKPGEGYGFWEEFCKGFSTPCRDLVRGDVTERARATLHAAIGELPTRRRRRVLLKITGWPRLGFLHEVFPDARFVHITRDAPAVINSMLNVDWWWGWRGPQNWRWGELCDEDRADWERFGRSFVALAGIEVRILDRAMDAARRTIPASSFLEVRYEDLCARPVDVFRQVIEFCELPWVERFEACIRTASLRSQNDRWKHELSPEQQRIAAYFATAPVPSPSRSYGAPVTVA